MDATYSKIDAFVIGSSLGRAIRRKVATSSLSMKKKHTRSTVSPFKLTCVRQRVCICVAVPNICLRQQGGEGMLSGDDGKPALTKLSIVFAEQSTALFGIEGHPACLLLPAQQRTSGAEIMRRV